MEGRPEVAVICDGEVVFKTETRLYSCLAARSGLWSKHVMISDGLAQLHFLEQLRAFLTTSIYGFSSFN